ncbi:hypothetical protein ACFVYJ_06405 [Pontibacter sp. JAM-7]|uniref:hypothetical protein n=1 Tax=Pontibacter sp. JAM-7 TaxID=3366581 RepID=UPI003AF82D6D
MPSYKRFGLLLPLLLTGCAGVQQTPAEWLAYYEIPAPDSQHHLVLCSNVDCAQKQTVQLSQAQMTRLRAIFAPAATAAEQERHQLAQAVGLLETMVAPALNTAGDGPGNTLGLFSDSNQLDCVAETSNTSVYLLLLNQADLLRFHQPAGRAHRGFFNGHMPHNSATIIDTTTAQRYVVDSWYGANGEPAWIAPAEDWLAGARPPK